MYDRNGPYAVSYQRSQALQAAWSLFNRSSFEERPQPHFTNRFKHLLDFDRKLDPDPRRPGTRGGFAFFSEPRRGTGNEVRFDLWDVLCLLVGLELIDLGVPQTEAIKIVRKVRLSLLTYCADLDRKVATSEEPLFMLLSRGELFEAYRGPRGGDKGPRIAGPVFVHGYREMAAAAERFFPRKVIAIEIGRYIRELPERLARTQPKKRGR